MNLALVGSTLAIAFSHASSSLVWTAPWSETTALVSWGMGLIVLGALVRNRKSRPAA